MIISEKDIVLFAAILHISNNNIFIVFEFIKTIGNKVLFNYSKEIVIKRNR